MPRTTQHRLTAEEREERRRRDRERLEAATRELLTSDGWKRWLRARAALNTYSWHNSLLIAQQAGERGITPTHVAGFKTWMKLGRAVRKGEKGLAVLAPCRPKKRDEDADEPDETRIFFRTVFVFDISQTDPVPGAEPTPLVPPRAPVTGDSHAHLLKPLEALVDEIGYRVEYRDTGQSDGSCNHRTRVIAVSDGLESNGKVSTLIHEVAHAMVGRDAGMSYAIEEVVVESVAYIGCAGAGLDTGCDSVPYIASWGSDEALEVMSDAAQLIDALARRIEQAVQSSGDD